MGNLTAIDLNTGDHLWQIPLGTSKDLAPFPFWWIKGAPNIGGPTVTASGLTFIAATSDYYLRAFKTETGEELAKFRLPTAGHDIQDNHLSEVSVPEAGPSVPSPT